MENKIVTAIFKDSTHTKVSDVWQYDYGQILRIQGLDLPTAVEVDFAVAGASESIARIGTTKDGVTDVVIPDSLIETGKNLVAYIYLRDSASGNTEYQIDMLVTKRAKPEAYDRPEDKELFGQAIEAVNTAADRAEKAGKTAQEAATKTGQDAEQTAQDRVEVAKMVETVTDISEQVKKVEDLSNKAQAAATKTEADAQQTAEDRVEVGKILETVKDVSEQVKTVDESVRKAKESERAAEGHRTAVEEMKNSVEQTASTFPQTVQEGVQAVENAGTAEVQEITQAGAAQKTAVEGAGTQAVESVENAQQAATEAVESAKTTAVQAVQAEGTTQTGNVTTEGTKQVKAVQNKGNEVLQSIPEDFQMQMESKLDKQQGVENKGKALVIGEDGNVAPGEVQSGGGDGIAIINTMNGESPLAIPDSAERVNKRLELGGKTEQVTTTGVNLFDEKLLLDFDSENYDKTQSGSGFYYYKFPVNGTVTVSTKNANKNGEYLTVGIKPDGSDKTWLSHGSAAITKYKTLTPEDGNIYLGVNNNLERVKSMIQNTGGIIINEGSVAKPYEPYTGNKPSPSPEYPQEIKNSGKWNEETQKYEVDVKITGKNLFDIEKAKNTQNWFTSVQSGYSDFEIYVGKGNTVTISYTDTLEAGLGFYAGIVYKKDGAVGAWLYNSTNISANTKKVTFTANEDYVYIRCSTNDISKFTDNIKMLQVEIGETQTDFIQGKEQSITITSDRPITKWDRLVEQGGQIGWLYGTKKYTVTGSENYIFGGAQYYSGISTNMYITNVSKMELEAVCDRLTRSKDIWAEACNNKDGFTINGGNQIHMRFFNSLLGVNDDATMQEKKAAYITYLKKEYEKGTPYEIVYQSLEPEFIPLPQSEQNAIRALKTYYPTTVITADGGELDPDIKVTYTADTKNYIDNKVSAKVASIIRQYRLNTANLLSLMPMETQAAMIENDTNNILENAEEMKHE